MITGHLKKVSLIKHWANKKKEEITFVFWLEWGKNY